MNYVTVIVLPVYDAGKQNNSRLMRDLDPIADRKTTDLLLKKHGFSQTGLNSEHCEYLVLVKREEQVIVFAVVVVAK